MVELLVDQAGEKQLIVIFTESSTAPDELKVRVAGSVPLKFKRFKTGNKMILPSEHWRKLRSTYTIRDGYKIIIERISSTDQFKMVEQSLWIPRQYISGALANVPSSSFRFSLKLQPYISTKSKPQQWLFYRRQRRPWTFDYRVTRRGRVLSGPQWQNFIKDNIVRVWANVKQIRDEWQDDYAIYIY
ncbi:hypothetical protein Gotur_007369 [Gossypium turneri]